MRYKKSIIFVTVLASIFVGLLLYKDRLASVALRQYLKTYDLEAQFTVERLGFSGLRLSNIVIPGLLKASSAVVQLDSGELRSVQIQVEELKMDKFINFKTNTESTKSPHSSALEFSTVTNVCKIIKPIGIDVKINKVSIAQKDFPVNFKVHKVSGDIEGQAKFEAQADASRVGPVSFKKINWLSEIKWGCGDNSLKVLLERWQAQIAGLQPGVKERTLKSIEIKGGVGSVELTAKAPIDLKLKVEAFWDAKIGDKSITGAIKKIEFAGGVTSKAVTGKLSGQDFSLMSPVALSMESLGLAVENLDLQKMFASGTYRVGGVEVRTKVGKTFVTGLVSQGKFKYDNQAGNLGFSLSDPTGSIKNLKGHLTYKSGDGELSLNLPLQKKALAISEQWNQLFPSLGIGPIEAEGSIEIGGQVFFADKKSAKPLALKVTAKEFESEYGELQNILWTHNLVNFDKLSSSPGRYLQVKKYIYGPTVEDIKVHYQVASPSKVLVESLELRVDDVQVATQSFVANPLNKSLSGFRAEITQLPLEKLLKLGLGSTATASGELKGFVKINFKGRVPILEGRLEAVSSGWIRYRKPGAPAFDPNLISGNPMTILENYLHDFYFESLEIDLKSDVDYNLKMTLRALGKNPQYLAGKPLKLNVNLEQNLLAGFKALMLTYDLPSRLKNKIEKLGSK